LSRRLGPKLAFGENRVMSFGTGTDADQQTGGLHAERRGRARHQSALRPFPTLLRPRHWSIPLRLAKHRRRHEPKLAASVRAVGLARSRVSWKRKRDGSSGLFHGEITQRWLSCDDLE
jgi:hypothetical protein